MAMSVDNDLGSNDYGYHLNFEFRKPVADPRFPKMGTYFFDQFIPKTA